MLVRTIFRECRGDRVVVATVNQRATLELTNDNPISNLVLMRPDCQLSIFTKHCCPLIHINTSQICHWNENSSCPRHRRRQLEISFHWQVLNGLMTQGSTECSASGLNIARCLHFAIIIFVGNRSLPLNYTSNNKSLWTNITDILYCPHCVIASGATMFSFFLLRKLTKELFYSNNVFQWQQGSSPVIGVAHSLSSGFNVVMYIECTST